MRSKHLKAKRVARKFLLSGIFSIPLAYILDCFMDTLTLHKRSFWELLLQPSGHEVMLCFVFSAFLLGLSLYGYHLINIVELKEQNLGHSFKSLQKTNQELEAVNNAVTLDIRSMVTSVKAKTNLIIVLKEKMDEETLFNTINSMDNTLMQVEDILNDFQHKKNQ